MSKTNRRGFLGRLAAIGAALAVAPAAKAAAAPQIVTVNAGGTGYTSAPAITFTGGAVSFATFVSNSGDRA